MANHPPIDGSAAEAPPVEAAEAPDPVRPDRGESGTYALTPLGLDTLSHLPRGRHEAGAGEPDHGKGGT